MASKRKLSLAQKAALKIRQSFHKRQANTNLATRMAIERERSLMASVFESDGYQAARRRILDSTRPGPVRKQQLAALRSRASAPYQHRIEQYRVRRTIALERYRADRKAALAGARRGLRQQERARKLVAQRTGVKFKRRKIAPFKLAKRGGFVPTPSRFKTRIESARAHGRLAIRQSFPATRAGYKAYYAFMLQAQASNDIQSWHYEVRIGSASISMNNSDAIYERNLWLTESDFERFGSMRTDTVSIMNLNGESSLIDHYFNYGQELSDPAKKRGHKGSGANMIKQVRKFVQENKVPPQVFIDVSLHIGKPF